MNTKKEIVKFLEELAVGVQEKEELTKRLLDEGNKILNDSYWHTKGQLYEINYILSTITRDQRKKN
ncbi:MAG: hypothetical protein Q7R33_05565 [Nitrosarchaeum sp.]|nr:hypothetical protein [Nitrosarchaeum sp.]